MLPRKTPPRLAAALLAAASLIGCDRLGDGDHASEARVADLEARLVSAQATIAALQAQQAATQAQVAGLSASKVLALAPFLDVTEEDGKPLVMLTGANLQIRSGAGNTGTANGLGNLIVGYNERHGGTRHCSRGTDGDLQPILDEAACLAAGGTWGSEQRTGSHYLVVGPYNDYTATGGVVFGLGNVSSAEGANVLGGGGNQATAWYAVVTAGLGNSARASHASVGGGAFNLATGDTAVVSGGRANIASGGGTAICGGSTNTATSDFGAVLGGNMQTASGTFQTVPAIP
jgi:uncharacterized coiled-coil protein SlyX